MHVFSSIPAAFYASVVTATQAPIAKSNRCAAARIHANMAVLARRAHWRHSATVATVQPVTVARHALSMTTTVKMVIINIKLKALVLLPEPCLNGGICVDGVASYTCFCKSPFVGDRCQHRGDPCQENTCYNGRCMPSANYRCENR